MDHAIRLASVSPHDHLEISCYIREMLSSNSNMIFLEQILECSDRPFETLLDSIIERLSKHLSWAVKNRHPDEANVVIDVLNLLSSNDELRIAFSVSCSLTKSLLQYIQQSEPTLINLFNWQFFLKDARLIDYIVQNIYKRMNSIGITTIRCLNLVFHSYASVKKRFLENPYASDFVAHLINMLQSSTDTVAVLHISAILLQMTKDKFLLEEENARSMLKLATSAIENQESQAHLEAACMFLSVACHKPMLLTGFRRSLMAGSMRRLFSTTSTTYVGCVFDLLIEIFRSKLLTLEFIPQHSVPFDILLRWLNGHPFEAYKATETLLELIECRFVCDREVQENIFEEASTVFINSLSDHSVGALYKSLHLSLAGKLFELLCKLQPSAVTSMLGKISVPVVSEQHLAWISFALLTVFSEFFRRSVKIGSEQCTLFLVALNDLDLLPSTSDVSNPLGNFLKTRKAVLEKEQLEELFVSITTMSMPTEDHIMSVKETQANPLQTENERLNYELCKVSSELNHAKLIAIEKDSQILALQLRCSSEASTILHYREKRKTLSSHFSHLRKEIVVLLAEVTQNTSIGESVYEFMNELIHEIRVIQGYTKNLEYKDEDTLKRLVEVEERLVLSGQESKYLQDQVAELRKYSDHLQETSRLAEECLRAQLEFLHDQKAEAETKLREGKESYHGCQEELMRVQLIEGQLRLELESLKGLLKIKDEQIAEYKSYNK